MHKLKESFTEGLQNLLRIKLQEAALHGLEDRLNWAFKDTLIQIYKFTNIFVFTKKWYAEGFTLYHFLIFEIYSPEIYKMFVK